MIISWITVILTSSNILVNANRTKSIPPSPSSIFDGEYADEDEFKYIVTIEKEDAWPHGGGIIIDKNWILTARHVIVKQFVKGNYFNYSDMGPLIVRPKYSNDQREFVGKPFYRAEKLFCHHIPSDSPVYHSDSDVGLIKLQAPLQLGIAPYNIRKIDFYSDDMDQNMDDENDIRVAGWGRLEPEDLSIIYLLRKAEISNSDRIKDWHNVRRYPAFRPFQQIMLRFPNHNPCRGDSGGPAVVRKVDSSEEYLFGIISWASNPDCQDRTFVQNVFHYRQWIEKIMQSEDDKETEMYSCQKFYNTEYNRPL
ncbi:mite allergen Der p 3-like [Brevipalpus obovatus]|uniref:mite allergen Der p 3-like n=1 Tax=Brevipalpus obovatus TaxID=246614 RepID=UPI003D9F8F0C